MSIAEKLTTIADNQQKVYDAGYEQGKIDGNTLLYATRLDYLYNKAIFPNGYELKVLSENTNGNMQNAFNGAEGIRKIVLDVPTGVDYDMYNFARGSSVEEIVLPDGIHFTNWNYFAYKANNLKKIIGKIDCSGHAPSNNNCINAVQNLEEVYFVPGSIDYSINISGSPNLIAASIQSIIDGLADLTGQTTQTLTLHATVGAKLTEAQKASASSKNWTLAY